ncbi:MAG TPA: hypothetical protein VFY02_10085 [Gaiellaceae bacterium]|nr:hypothetical protein [Gaiellaceae bacterium]
MRYAAFALLAALLAGCGGEGGDAAAEPELTAAAVREAPERVRAEGSFAYEASYVRRVPDEPEEEYLLLSGAVDVRDGSGRMEADLSRLLEGLESTDELAEPIALRWTPERLTAVVDGREQSLRRGEAREGAGLIGRLPDEPLGVLELLGQAEGMGRVGAERLDGVSTIRFAGHVDPRRAGDGTVPAEFGLGLEGLLAEPRLPLDVWLDAGGLPRRIEYVFRLKPLEAEDTPVLPARSITGVYELSDFGDPVEVD